MNVHHPIKPDFFHALLKGGIAKTVYNIEVEVDRKERRLALKKRALPRVYSGNYILHPSGWRICD